MDRIVENPENSDTDSDEETDEDEEDDEPAPYVPNKSGNKPMPALVPNKVYAPYYKRYKPILPEHEQIEFQPYTEIDKRDEDIAMLFVYGEDQPEYFDAVKTKQVRRQAVLQHKGYKEKMEKREQSQGGMTGGFGKASSETDLSHMSVSAIIASRKKKNELPSDFDGGKLLEHEEKIVTEILMFWIKKRTISQRIRAISEKKAKGFNLSKSGWGLLQSGECRRKLAVLYVADYKNKVRKRFKKIIGSVLACNRFIFILAEMSGYTAYIVKKLREYQDEQMALTKDELNNTATDGKFIFNPSKYKVTQETLLSTDVGYTLTKPWYNRTKYEIQEAIKGLQILRCFSELPANTQRLLATVGWIISVPEEKVIIRQGQQSQDYYILLSGKVSQTEFIGESFGEDKPTFKHVKTYHKDSIFGEEAILKPECIREYSVTSCTKCDIMTINVHHYYSCSMEPSDRRSTASDHIKFISSNCLFLAKFPKQQLVDDAEHNIYLVYFRPGHVIEKSMADADWVYVLRWGDCRSLLEVPPGHRVMDAYNAKNISFDAEVKAPDVIMEDRMTEPAKGGKAPSDFMKSRIFVNKLVDIEVDRLRLANPSSERNIDGELEEIREKKRAAELLLRPKRKREEREREEALRCERETIPLAHITGRSPRLPSIQTGPLTARKQSLASRRKSLEARKQSKTARKQSLPPVNTNFPRKLSAKCETIQTKLENLKKKEKIEGGLVTEKWTDQSEIDSEKSERSGEKNSIVYKSKKMSIKVVNGNYEIEHTVNTLPSTNTSSTSTKKSFESERSIRRQLTSFGEGQSTRDSNEKKSSLQSEWQSSKTSVYGQPPQLPIYQGLLHSTWKLHKGLCKGDQIGFEWIDLEDGEYREPEEDPVLVSDGCEMVLIRKEFIAKYMNYGSRHTSEEV